MKNMQIAFLLLIYTMRPASGFLVSSRFVPPHPSITTTLLLAKKPKRTKKKPQANGFGATPVKSTPSKSDLAFDKAIKAKVERGSD